jgi:signal transduction histidine kinase
VTRRIIVVTALLVALVFCGGVVAWDLHVRSIAALVDAQVAAARALLNSGATSPQAIAAALQRPGLHIAVDEGQGLPPGPPGQAPPFPGPPGQGPPQGEGPPPQGEGPPPGARPFAGQLAGIEPQRVDRPPLSVVVAPDLQDLQRFLTADVAATFVCALIVAGLGLAIVLQLQNAAHRSLQAHLEERRAAAAEFQRFLADAGHELRTPLTIVSGYVDILSAKAADQGPDARILAGMRAETARMRGLVEKMLLLARLETPVSVPRLIDPQSVAGDVAQAMAARYPERTIRVAGNGAASLVIDYDDLYEALRNLVENALRYAPESPVTVETSASERTAVIRVIDRGPGIRPEEQDAVFERFYRGRNTSDGEGSGLGLAIVRRVAARWNGDVALDSNRSGTTFTLRFPLADEEIHDTVAR